MLWGRGMGIHRRQRSLKSAVCYEHKDIPHAAHIDGSQGWPQVHSFLFWTDEELGNKLEVMCACGVAQQAPHSMSAP